MILTEQFVFMHVPKTGGTFVTRILRELLTPGKWDWRMHAIGRRYGVYLPLYPYKYRELRQHAMRKHIPASSRELPILSCVRNPYDVYVSEYTFNWWREHADFWFADLESVIAEWGPLEKFDFPTFVKATIKYSQWSQTCRENYPQLKPMSYASTEWLHYHCLQPADAIGDATTTAEAIPRVKEATQGIQFLLTHRLNQDLYGFLARMGYPKDQIDPILTRRKIHPGRRRRSDDDHWANRYSDDLRELLRDHESLLFEMFPEFDEFPQHTPKP